MEEKNTLEILGILSAIRKRIIIVIIIPIILSLISGLLSYFYFKPVYEAKTFVIVGVNDAYKIEPGAVTLYQGILSTCIQIAKSSVVAENAAVKLKNEISAEALHGGFNVSVQQGTQILIMSFRSDDPQDALKKVEAMTQAFMEEEARLLSNARVQIMDTAKLPTSPILPRKQRNIILAFIAGLAASIGIALLLDVLDNTIKDEEDVAKYLDIPVVGVIPKY